MRRPLLTLIATILCTGIFASQLSHTIGGKSAGMGNSSVVQINQWSAFNNQAALAFLETKGVGAFYENRFLLPELGLKGGVFTLPTKSGTFGLSAVSFGNQLYNETKIGLAYGKKLAERFAVGVQLDYLTVGLGENYGRSSAFSVEIGLLAQITDELSVGAQIFNPNRARLSNATSESLPSIIRFGAGYHFSEKVQLTAEMEKDIDEKAMFKSGLEYHVSKPIFIRAGIATNPFLSTFGFGVLFKQFELDFATTYHSVLGYSPQFSLGYTF